jgi:hypothetical protein
VRTRLGFCAKAIVLGPEGVSVRRMKKVLQIQKYCRILSEARKSGGMHFGGY